MESLAHAGLSAIIAALTLNAPLVGTFALLDGTPQSAAEMTVHQTPSGMTSFDIFATKDQATQPIRAYDVDMTELMHFIVVSDDYTQFIHVHPSFNAVTGHFNVSMQLDPSRRYFAYADVAPTGIGQQVYLFMLQPPQTGRMAPPATTATGAPLIAPTASPTSASAGPYRVQIGTTTLHANAPTTIALTIERDDALATDLLPYLGAAAHAVFVETASHAYVHVHPVVKGTSMHAADMAMPSQAGPQLVMHVPSLPVGHYKLWLQFRGGNGLYTAPFTLAAR